MRSWPPSGPGRPEVGTYLVAVSVAHSRPPKTDDVLFFALAGADPLAAQLAGCQWAASLPGVVMPVASEVVASVAPVPVVRDTPGEGTPPMNALPPGHRDRRPTKSGIAARRSTSEGETDEALD